jgi:tetratricopeptide (TPR) repeat protein
MPKRSVQKISHSALTNHRIPVRPGAPQSPFLTAGASGLPGLRLLNAGDSSAPLPLVTRLAAYGELLSQAPALVETYSALLVEAARKLPQDPVVLAALAHRAFLENRADSQTLLTKAIEKGAPGAILHLDLGIAFDNTGKLDESVTAFERGAKLYPFSQDIRKRLVLGYIRQKAYGNAQTGMERYVEDFPEDDFMRGLLRQIPRQRK